MQVSSRSMADARPCITTDRASRLVVAHVGGGCPRSQQRNLSTPVSRTSRRLPEGSTLGRLDATGLHVPFTHCTCVRALFQPCRSCHAKENAIDCPFGESLTDS